MSTIRDALQAKNETEAIIALTDIINSHWDYEDITELTDAERVFVLVENVEREVNNGGFDQFFMNSSGDHAEESHAALLEIGAVKTAALLEKAMSIFIDGFVPQTYEERMIVLDEVGEDEAQGWFEDCDSEYYDGLDENIAALLLEYVKENIAQFRDAE
jgi:hypothetical protein